MEDTQKHARPRAHAPVHSQGGHLFEINVYYYYFNSPVNVKYNAADSAES